jgi:hypothetical protein
MVGRVEKVTPSSGLQIRHKGVFDLDRLYSEITGWINDHDYGFQEKEHSDKGKDKGKEIKYVFSGEKETTSYFKYNIKIILELNEINPLSENLVSGNAKITLHSNVSLDHKDHWSHNALSDFFFKFYNNYVIKEKAEAQIGMLQTETFELWDLIKDILEFNR